MDFHIIFQTILYKPIFNALVLLYQYLPGHDFGVSIIVLTCVVRFLLYPFTFKSIKSQKVLQEIQPKIKEIQAKFKNKKEEQARAMMALYKEQKISPFSGCLPLLIQLPILIALFLVLKNLTLDKIDGNILYSFVPNPGAISPMFLGIMNLTQKSSLLAILAGVFQFFQSKMTIPQTKKNSKNGNDFSQIMQKQMLYFFPILTVFILWGLPSAIGLYWLATTLFSIGQQYLVFNR